MEIVLDTCVLIGLAKKEFAHDLFSDAVGSNPVYMTAISLGELHFGVESCPDPVERSIRNEFLHKFETLPVLPITQQTSYYFGVLSASLKSSNKSVRHRYNDIWIAATAIENSYCLLTLNSRDFQDIPRLKLKVLKH